MAAFCQLQRNFLNWLQTATVCVLTGLNNMQMQCEEQLWISLSKTKRPLFPREPIWKATVDITTKALLLVHYLHCASSYPHSFLFKVKSTSRGSQLHSVTTIIFTLWQYTKKSCVVKPPAGCEAIANHMMQFAFMSLQMAPRFNSSNRGTSYSLFVSLFLCLPFLLLLLLLLLLLPPSSSLLTNARSNFVTQIFP